MKRKKIVTIVVIFFIISIFALGATFASLKLSANEVEQGYIETYRAEAEAYIRSSPEIIGVYGDGDSLNIEFDGSISYTKMSGGATVADLFNQVFKPQVPETIEEFSAGIKTMELGVQINGDDYIVVLENNGQSKLVVSCVTQVE